MFLYREWSPSMHKGNDVPAGFAFPDTMSPVPMQLQQASKQTKAQEKATTGGTAAGEGGAAVGAGAAAPAGGGGGGGRKSGGRQATQKRSLVSNSSNNRNGGHGAGTNPAATGGGGEERDSSTASGAPFGPLGIAHQQYQYSPGSGTVLDEESQDHLSMSKKALKER
jgi:hypothetical protein